jgi:hypothetical protein
MRMHLKPRSLSSLVIVAYQEPCGGMLDALDMLRGGWSHLDTSRWYWSPWWSSVAVTVTVVQVVVVVGVV